MTVAHLDGDGGGVADVHLHGGRLPGDPLHRALGHRRLPPCRERRENERALGLACARRQARHADVQVVMLLASLSSYLWQPWRFAVSKAACSAPAEAGRLWKSMSRGSRCGGGGSGRLNCSSGGGLCSKSTVKTRP